MNDNKNLSKKPSEGQSSAIDWSNKVYDYSNMSIDELLDSIRTDIDPQYEKKKAAPPVLKTPALPVGKSTQETAGKESGHTGTIEVRDKARVIKKAEYTFPPVKKRRGFGYYKGLAIFVFIMLVAVFVGAVFFWRYLDAYELSSLDHIIQYMQNNVDYGYWEKQVINAITPRLSVFEAGRDISPQVFRSEIRDVPYSLHRNFSESTPDAPVYYVRAGARNIGIVRFSVLKSAGYGFNMWEIGSIEFLDSFIDGFDGSVSVTASQNAQVKVNGIPLTKEFLIDCGIEYGAAYKINGIYGEAEVSVTEWDGRQSIPLQVENGSYFFPIVRPFSREYNVLVPEGINVFLDGKIVSDEFITDTEIIPEILTGDSGLPLVAFLFTRYEFESEITYKEPVLTAKDEDGAELLPFELSSGEIIFLDAATAGDPLLSAFIENSQQLIGIIPVE